MGLVMDYLALSKNCKKKTDDSFLNYSLAVVGTSSTQLLSCALKGYAYEEGIALNVFDAPYNQLDAQFLDQDSSLYKENPNAILLYISSESLQTEFAALDLDAKKDFANTVMNRLVKYWDAITKNSKAKILQYNFVNINSSIFGSYGISLEYSFEYQISKLNMLLMDNAQNNSGVYVVDLNNQQSLIGRNSFYDDKFYYVAKMPISTKALPYAAKIVIDVIKIFLGKIKKCIILDLDNTLWGGVIGDDGLENIQIGELGIGQAYSDFQRWLKSLKQRGIILAVCSKNEVEIAKLPFEKHPDMVLRLDDFACFVANWDNKAANVISIQKTLNIGMDSIVFIDDNPFERDQVKSAIPELCVPDMPQDAALYVKYLKELNLFETVSFSLEDSKRNDLYRVEAKRLELEKDSVNYDDYLKNLEMEAKCSTFDSFSIPRVSQLTQRSNQFNLRTIRYSVDDIERISKDDNYITRYFNLKDKLGEYGLISVLIMKKENDYLFIDTLLMSCRVLKRGMEEFIFNSIATIAKELGYKKVVGEYIKTEKNAMVENLYTTMGYEDVGNNRFVLDVDNYKSKNTYIKG